MPRSLILTTLVPMRTILVRTGDKSSLDDRCVLAHHAKQRVYRGCSRSRTQADWEEHRVARRHVQLFYEDAK